MQWSYENHRIPHRGSWLKHHQSYLQIMRHWKSELHKKILEMLFGILKKTIKPSKQGFHQIHHEYPKVFLIDWPSKKIITKGKLLSVPCEVVECGLALTLEYPGSSTPVPSTYTNWTLWVTKSKILAGKS